MEKVEFTGLVKMIGTPVGAGFNLEEVKTALSVSKNLDMNLYMSEDGNYNAAGYHALMHCYVQGLIVLMHRGDALNIKNSGKALCEIVRLLEDGLVRVDVNTDTADMKYF